ncbi:MAG: amidohydrolase [Clostridia bacterium]|nr:amidohydrolase [Clostridia bacterium]
MKIDENIKKLAPSIMQDKDFFWNHPEAGFKEFETSKYIIKRLQEIGFTEIHTEIAKTGVVAILRGKTEHPCILLRSDMDAVCMDNNGRMKHTCGHDAHMSILLAVAELLFKNKDKLKGTVKILFQPAEDDIGGAKPMIDEGAMENPKVDKAFGLHVWSELPHGTIGIKEGAVMASTDPFTVKITGKGGHAAIPEKCIDPIYASSQIIEELHNMDKQYNKKERKVVLGITAVHGGSATNVIPETVEMKGICRTYDNQIRIELKQKLQEKMQDISKETGAKIKLKHIEERPVVVNSAEESQVIQQIATEIVGIENVVTNYKTMCSEDFSFFLQEVPGAFVFIGCQQEEYYPQHNENFKVDEKSILLGAQIMYNIAKRYLY